MEMHMTRLHKPHWIAGICALLLGLPSLPAQADDDSPYPPVAPRGSAQIRLYNASGQETGATVGPVSLSEVAPFASGDYEHLQPGRYGVRVGSQTLPVALEADRQYTLVNQSGTAQLVEEPPFRSRQKALLRLQNLSDRPLALKTADGRTEVVSSVAPHGRGEREINPVKVGLALFDGERKVADLKPVVLDRGETLCLYVTGSPSSLTPVWVRRPARE